MPVDKDGFYKMVGRRIQHLRKAKHKSQSDLADAIGLKDRVVIARWEAGTRQIPLHSLVDISNVLGEDLDYLLGRRKADRKEDFRIDKRKPKSEPVLQDPNNPYILNIVTPTLASDLFPGVKSSDPRLLLFDRFISYLQEESAFAHIYTSQEIQEAIEDHFGVSVDLNDLSDFAEAFEHTAQTAKNARAEVLLSRIESEIAEIYRRQKFPDDVVKEISSRVDSLRDYLDEQGYAIGQTDAEFEKQNMEDLEYEDDFNLDLAADFYQSVENGHSEGIQNITGPQDWDDV